MIRATTPIHTFNFPDDISVENVTGALITYSQNGDNVLEKTLDDVSIDTDNNTLWLVLTEAETKLFAPGKALIQIRIKYNDESVLASQMLWLIVRPALNSEEL